MSRRALELLLACLLVAVTLAVFAPILAHPFIYYDDDVYVFANPVVLQGLNWDTFRWAWTSEVQGNWHPLTMLSLLADVSLWSRGSGARSAPWPGGFHLTSLLLHAASVAVLFFTLTRWTGRLYCSALVAALFAIHPTRVESVAWIAERKDVLSGFFFMLTLAAYGAYVRRPSLGRHLVVAVCLACGLMSKAMLVTVPLLLLLLDVWPLRRSALRTAGRFDPLGAGLLVAEKLPWLMLVAVSSWITFHVQQKQGFVVSLEFQSPGERLITATNAYGAYLHSAIWPTRLCLMYPLPLDIQVTSATLASAAVLAGGTLAALLTARRWAFVPVGWFWFVGMLVPVIGLVQIGGTARCDRYTYLPFIGLFLLGVWSIAGLLERRLAPRARRYVGGALAAAVLLPLSVLCLRQVGYWRDAETLFTHATEVTENNHLAHYNLANALASQRRFDEALVHYDRTLELYANYPAALFNKSSTLMRLSRYGEAFQALLACNVLSPDDPNTLYNLGQCAEKLGRLNEAAFYYQQSLEHDPRHATYLALATMLNRLNRTAEAVRTFEQLIKAAPNNRQAQLMLAWVLATHHESSHRDPARALEICSRIVPRVPTVSSLFVSAHDTWGAAYAANGDFQRATEEAQQAYERALRERRARELANSPGGVAEWDRQVKAIRRRLDYYQRKQPYFVNPAEFPD
ncbi:MAG: tetratricopeptide repeat protein [Pirellulales bacterium]|nr:tetratricopeptide repeat protein [Pirellulales bacterium]